MLRLFTRGEVEGVEKQSIFLAVGFSTLYLLGQRAERVLNTSWRPTQLF